MNLPLLKGRRVCLSSGISCSTWNLFRSHLSWMPGPWHLQHKHNSSYLLHKYIAPAQIYCSNPVLQAGQPSISGWFSSSLPPSIHKHSVSQVTSGTTWGIYPPMPSLNKGSQFPPPLILVKHKDWISVDSASWEFCWFPIAL